MDPQHKTLAQFAKSIGISRQAVYLAKDSGLIPTVEIAGRVMVDVNDKRVQDYANSRERKQGIRNGEEKPKTTRPVKVKSSILSENMQVGDLDREIPDYLKDIVDSNQLTFELMKMLSKSEMDKIKSYEMTKSIIQKREEASHQLIDRQLVIGIFGTLYDIDRAEFLTLKSKLVPDLAGIFGCTDAEKQIAAEARIEEELYKILGHIKIEIDKFLNSEGVRLINDK